MLHLQATCSLACYFHTSNMVCYTSILACFRAPGAVVVVPIIVQGVPAWVEDARLTVDIL